LKFFPKFPLHGKVKSAGFLLIVATNQLMSARHDEAGIGRGDSRGNVPRTADDAWSLLRFRYGAAVESGISQPKPGMLLRAAADLPIDLAQSWMIGDAGATLTVPRRRLQNGFI